MKISIITPVFNAVKTIEKTILSVLNQNLDSELEYIIIDGGSTDGTLDIIHKYLPKISILVSEKDLGIYDAMNKGVSRATGDIVGIINSDDWYNDGALKIIEKIFKSNQDISIIYSPLDNYFDHKYLNTFIPGTLENLELKFTLNHPSCFIKKTVYNQIGLYDLRYSMAADYDLILRSYKSNFYFFYVDTPLASYSLNGATSKIFSKFKQIKESWQVGEKNNRNASLGLKLKRYLFYINWILKEVAVLPIKLVIKPTVTRKIKTSIRNIVGKIPADNYGAW